jgi:hypothetical protein
VQRFEASDIVERFLVVSVDMTNIKLAIVSIPVQLAKAQAVGSGHQVGVYGYSFCVGSSHY